MLRSSDASALRWEGGRGGGAKGCEGPGAGVRGQQGSQPAGSAVRGQRATGPLAARERVQGAGQRLGLRPGPVVIILLIMEGGETCSGVSSMKQRPRGTMFEMDFNPATGLKNFLNAASTSLHQTFLHSNDAKFLQISK